MTSLHHPRARIAGVAGRVRRSVAIWRFANRFSRKRLDELVAREVDRLNADAPRGERVALVVGAGGELFACASRLEGAKLISVDRDLRRGPDVIADVQQLGCFENASVDVVFLLEVLEHVGDPTLALAEIHRVLRPGGTLILSTPFALEIHDAPADYYRFTHHGLERLLARFDAVEIHARTGYATACVVPWLRLTQSPHSADVLLGLFALGLAALCSPLIALLDRAIRSSAWTTGYVAVARR